jgi:hypothetical protein
MDYRLELRADCSRCQALCCVSLPFDQGESFAFDKPADTVCRHLGSDSRCRIHHELVAQGHGGCAAYDCYGAGQRVTQELFAGVSWKDQPLLQAAMFEAFRRLKRVHELRLLLREAARLALPSSKAREREQLLACLEPPRGFNRESLAALELAALEAAVRAWLRSLSGVLQPARPRQSLMLLRR